MSVMRAGAPGDVGLPEVAARIDPAQRPGIVVVAVDERHLRVQRLGAGDQLGWATRSGWSRDEGHGGEERGGKAGAHGPILWPSRIRTVGKDGPPPFARATHSAIIRQPSAPRLLPDVAFEVGGLHDAKDVALVRRHGRCRGPGRCRSPGRPASGDGTGPDGQAGGVGRDRAGRPAGRHAQEPRSWPT